MKTMIVVVITAVETWFAAAGAAGKSVGQLAYQDGYVRGVSDLAEQLTSRWGAIGKSEEVRLAAIALMTHAKARTAVSAQEQQAGRPLLTR